MCDDNLNICVSNCNSGGGGGGGEGGVGSSPIVMTPEQEAAVKRCGDTLGAANVDGDESVTHSEFLLHVDLYASELCPGYLRPLKYADEFDSISCLLCTGLLDPFNLATAYDGNCPCMDGTSAAGPISFQESVMTVTEGMFYCDLVMEAAAISCSQPDKACYDSCYAAEATCQETCLAGMAGTGGPDDAAEPDAFVTCIVSCNDPFYSCLAGCPTTTPATTTANSDTAGASTAGGGSAGNVAVTTEIGPGVAEVGNAGPVTWTGTEASSSAPPQSIETTSSGELPPHRLVLLFATLAAAIASFCV